MSDTNASEVSEVKVTKTTRDQGNLRAALERWLIGRVGEGAGAAITAFEAPEANGMSSETILFDATWDAGDGAGPQSHRLVMRLAPPADAEPVFQRYDMTQQYETIRLVGELTDIPVPELVWNEPDDAPLGAPFFVMKRVDGIVPPDVMPYTFGDCWIADASDDQRAELTRATVEVLAKLHAIDDPATRFALLESPGAEDDSPLRRHVAQSRAWLDWSVGDEPSPLLERCFAWLEEHWPEVEPPTVVSWGDARIGNMMYRDFRPVAVLDWEMAALGPAELDVAWLIFLHRFFDDLTVDMGMPGMPDFLRRSEVEALYAEISGYEPQHMDWFLMYAATRHGIVFTRISRRAAHFGDAPMPDDPDDAIMHRATLEAMLDGTYWSTRR